MFDASADQSVTSPEGLSPQAMEHDFQSREAVDDDTHDEAMDTTPSYSDNQNDAPPSPDQTQVPDEVGGESHQTDPSITYAQEEENIGHEIDERPGFITSTEESTATNIETARQSTSGDSPSSMMEEAPEPSLDAFVSAVPQLLTSSEGSAPQTIHDSAADTEHADILPTAEKRFKSDEVLPDTLSSLVERTPLYEDIVPEETPPVTTVVIAPSRDTSIKIPDYGPSPKLEHFTSHPWASFFFPRFRPRSVSITTPI
ncbi:unnamed protein product [Heligmosomoides polygyrus]|uniref:Uncharacterized protein n=1 Tax=Heligmosomoides polygyrus TaxID=6339 RepID=A0A183GJT3_HELPZ|nr:unnamed protein product [Heligmosomoides polygyrus]